VDGIAYDAALAGETATVGGEPYAVEISVLAVATAAPATAPSSLAAPAMTEAGAGAVHIKPGDDVEKDQVLLEIE
jgi:hypothetical protein